MFLKVQKYYYYCDNGCWREQQLTQASLKEILHMIVCAAWKKMCMKVLFMFEAIKIDHRTDICSFALQASLLGNNAL